MLTYNSTISVYSFHKHCKESLNTIGNGWRQSKDFFQTNFKVEPINPSTMANQKPESIIPPNGRDNPCENLLLASDEENDFRFETDLIVSLPQIEDGDDILNIRLPFKRKQNFNFNAKASAFVILKYYVTVSKCYEFRKQSSERFDMRFLKLVKEKFLPFLQRDNFYPGFGAILRISESLNHRAIVSRDIENDSTRFVSQLKSNATGDNNSEDLFTNDVQDEIYKYQQNESSFFEQVVHFVHLDDPNENKKIEILFFGLVAAVISLAFLILCCCLIMRRRRKSKSKEGLSEEKSGRFKSFMKRFKNEKKVQRKESVSESNICPKSSSILAGNDFDDTGDKDYLNILLSILHFIFKIESRVSTQTKSSGLSLKDLIHAEISKRPSRPSKEQIKALSRNSKSTK